MVETEAVAGRYRASIVITRDALTVVDFRINDNRILNQARIMEHPFYNKFLEEIAPLVQGYLKPNESASLEIRVSDCRKII